MPCAQVGATAAGFMAVFGVTLFVCWLVSWGDSRAYLWGRYSTSVITSAVVVFFQVFVLSGCVLNGVLSTGSWIRRPVAWAWVNSVLIFASTFTGIVASVSRLFMMVMASVFHVFQLENSILPSSGTGSNVPVVGGLMGWGGIA
jgi:hypothetical protein